MEAQPQCCYGISDEERKWALISHLSAASGYLTFIGFFLGPLIVWLWKRKEYEFVDDQAKEALNFQISIFIYEIASAVLALIVVGAITFVIALIYQLVGMIFACIHAYNGERYRYPHILRLIK